MHSKVDEVRVMMMLMMVLVVVQSGSILSHRPRDLFIATTATFADRGRKGADVGWRRQLLLMLLHNTKMPFPDAPHYAEATEYITEEASVSYHTSIPLLHVQIETPGSIHIGSASLLNEQNRRRRDKAIGKRLG